MKKENHILKFRKIDKFLIDSLVHSYIYFASPDKLNDPFDCKIDIAKSIRKAISESSGPERETLNRIFGYNEVQELIRKVQRKIKKFGVFSGSRSPAITSSVMWSHYADSHRGVCLIYVIPTEPEKFYRPNQIFSVQDVRYGSNKLVEWFKELPLNEKIHYEAFTEMIRTMLTIKDICWQYEYEVRMIRTTFGTVPIDQSYLKHVCFGLDSEEDEMKLIRRILEKFNYDVRYHRIQRTDDDFGIIDIEID
jgi:hypothetical protein